MFFFISVAHKVPTIPGIISKNAQDQALILQALLDQNLQNKLDGSVVPITWNSQVSARKLIF